MAEEYTLKTRVEQYLQAHEGNLKKYYDAVAAGYSYRTAFLDAVCKPDMYRIRSGGYYEQLSENNLATGSPEDHRIHEVLDHLEETASEYPEDHPLWQIRR